MFSTLRNTYCFSITDNRPYWFDIKKEMSDIWNRTVAIKDSIDDTITWLKTRPPLDDVSVRFTGIDLVCIYLFIYLLKHIQGKHNVALLV